MENHSDGEQKDKILGNLALHINKKKQLNNNDWETVLKYMNAVEDPQGQWKYPLRCTLIPGNQITMKNVPYKVLGIDDTGHTKVMHPEKDYGYPGGKVLEIPMTTKFKPLLSKLNNYIKMG